MKKQTIIEVIELSSMNKFVGYLLDVDGLGFKIDVYGTTQNLQYKYYSYRIVEERIDYSFKLGQIVKATSKSQQREPNPQVTVGIVVHIYQDAINISMHRHVGDSIYLRYEDFEWEILGKV